MWDQKAVTQEKYDRLDDERKTLWRKAAVAESELSKLNESVNVAQRNAFNALTRAQSSGLKAVRRLTERLGLSGVYGPLAELISVEPKFKLATEVTAGNSLFHVVVDTDETASQLMSELFREKSGRVTFMPLNRLSPKNVTYPDHDSVTPLIDMIEYDPTIESAVRQVFGTTVVAMNLDIGSQIAHSNELNAITINGDRVNTKGVLTGGFMIFVDLNFQLSRSLEICTHRLPLKIVNIPEFKTKSTVKAKRLTKLIMSLAELLLSIKHFIEHLKV